MKRFLTLVIALGMMLSFACASFPDTWNGVFFASPTDTEDELPPSAMYYTFYLSGDTIISDLKYRKLYLDGEYPVLGKVSQYYVANIRLSADEKQIYIQTKDKEYLLFDFSVTIGDTRRVHLGVEAILFPRAFAEEEVVRDLEVLSIENYGGTRSIVLKDYFAARTRWIEGVGSTIGLTSYLAGYVGVTEPVLLCASQNGQQVYMAPDEAVSAWGYKNACPVVESVITNVPNFAEGMKWVSGILSGGECEGKVDRCTLQGDTVIEGKTYHKILHQHNRTQWVWEFPNEPYEYLAAPTISHIVPIAVDGQKIYVRYKDTDLLMYDFSLKIGDSIPMYGWDYYSDYFELIGYAHVKATDSVTLLDGRKVKQLRYDMRMRDMEYVGSEYGILSPVIMPAIPTCGYSCSCFSLNGEPLFETSSGDCSILNEVIYSMETSAPVVPDDRFLLSLSDDILHIQISDKLLQAGIYTIHGQCVLHTANTDIDVTSLPQGMYILRALSADRQELQAKFIRE